VNVWNSRSALFVWGFLNCVIPDICTNHTFMLVTGIIKGTIALVAFY
jgi:hypothetical protein